MVSFLYAQAKLDRFWLVDAAECLAARLGLLKVELGLKKVIVESDCKELIYFFQGDTMLCPWSIKVLVKDCKFIALWFEEIYFHVGALGY